MKLNLFSKALLCTAVLAMASCSDDKLDGNDPSAPNPSEVLGDGVYFTIDFDLPSSGGSRSVTGDPDDNTSTSTGWEDENGDYHEPGGVEVGKDYENNVNGAIVVLAQANDTSFIAAANVTSLSALDATIKDSYRATSAFSKTELEQWYSQLTDEYKKGSNAYQCFVFIFANPPEKLTAKLFGGEYNGVEYTAPEMGSPLWTSTICELDNVSNISSKDHFLMTNASLAKREIPHSLSDWASYSDEHHPFDLSGYNVDVNIDNEGAIKLERAAARFDFRDGSTLGNFKYHVVYDIAITDDMTPAEVEIATPLIDIQLTTMSLVNVDKTFYALRRVSNTGSPVPSDNNKILLCAPEKRWSYADGKYSGGNYVVDASYRWKNNTAQTLAGIAIPTNVNYSGHFFYPFLTNDGKIDNTFSEGQEDYSDSRWYTSRCSEVAEGERNNTIIWNSDHATTPYSDYRIWTYATENTIAGIDDQINGISTGVVFKGKMVATVEALASEDEDVKALALAINNKNANFGNSDKAPVIYEFGGNLYLTWPKIREAALAAALAHTEVKWVVNEGEPATSDKGHWEIVGQIDRKNTLYMAVFGSAEAGFGSFEFTYTKHEVDENGNPTGVVVGPFTGVITDNVPVNPNSANAAWEAWNNAGNPSTGELKSNYQKAVTNADITIYQRGFDPVDQWGYYCYYYYWNRHNNNGRDGAMGPMEFAVVRNNVYKLTVTDIKRLGHPRISANDPNRPYGGTKDENENVYLTVTAEVLPWVVRVNNIEF